MRCSHAHLPLLAHRCISWRVAATCSGAVTMTPSAGKFGVSAFWDFASEIC